MQKKFLSLLLALVLILALIPAAVQAAENPKVDFNGHQYQMVDTGMTWTEAEAYCQNLGGHLLTITSKEEQAFIEGLIEKGEKNYYWMGGYCEADRVFKWTTGEEMKYTAWASGEPNNYQDAQDKMIIYRLENPKTPGSAYQWDDVRNEGTVDGESFFSESSFGFICEYDNIASSWAQKEMKKANELALIPESLRTADMTKRITRAEFAAVAVKLYEKLSGTKAVAAAVNPFTDTKDPEVLKAYNVGITSGTSTDKFSPDTILNREQAATMLTRVLKRVYIPNWTLATDESFALSFTQPAKFADDDKISSWAKPSVYFMAANGIITGLDKTNFGPRAITEAEKAAGYASATREQAIIIGARMVGNLDGKKIEYTESTAPVSVPDPDPAPAGLTLADIVKAAVDAGYTVNYTDFARSLDFEKDFKNLTDKCFIDIDIKSADGKWSISQTFKIYECKTAADAQENAKIQTSKILTHVFTVNDRFFIEHLEQPQEVVRNAINSCLEGILKAKPIKAADLLSYK